MKPFPDIQLTAPAKLNLFLHVTGRRSDGYHLLESLVVFTVFGDRLEIGAADDLSLTVTGPFAPALAMENDNLILQAARMLQREGGARMTLHKQIPVGAGLGGGSTDAAAAIHGLAQLWNVSFEEAKKEALALSLGSDVPVCLSARPCWVAGIGERLMPVAMHASLWGVLVNPRRPLLTKDVFQHFTSAFDDARTPVPAFDSADALLAFLRTTRNALEPAAIALMPEIGVLLEALRKTPGNHLARMSGSGATCFGLYKNDSDAKAAAAQLTQDYPDYWITVTEIDNETQ